MKLLRDVTNELGLGTMVPYLLRHSGASHDRLTNERTLEECKKRGRWANHKSLVRYEKAARVAQLWNDLLAALQSHCTECDSRLADVLLGRKSGPAPPRRPGTPRAAASGATSLTRSAEAAASRAR